MNNKHKIGDFSKIVNIQSFILNCSGSASQNPEDQDYAPSLYLGYNAHTICHMTDSMLISQQMKGVCAERDEVCALLLVLNFQTHSIICCQCHCIWRAWLLICMWKIVWQQVCFIHLLKPLHVDLLHVFGVSLHHIYIYEIVKKFPRINRDNPKKNSFSIITAVHIDMEAVSLVFVCWSYASWAFDARRISEHGQVYF